MSSADGRSEPPPDEPSGFLAAVEESLAILVGADPDTAAELAHRVLGEWPEPGVLVVSAAAASRWGIDIVPAMDRLAAGDPLRGVMSEYELRTAAEEAEDEADRALDRLADRLRSPGAQGPRASGPHVLVGPHPIRAAALAATAGEPTWQLPHTPGPDGVDGSSGPFVAMLAARLGVRLITDGSVQGPLSTSPYGVRSGSPYVGFIRVCQL